MCEGAYGCNICEECLGVLGRGELMHVPHVSVNPSLETQRKSYMDGCDAKCVHTMENPSILNNTCIHFRALESASNWVSGD